MPPSAADRWLLLIHQIPPKPSYIRVKVWRRLQRLGAVAIKNSVYVLPRSDETQEDFHWVSAEIVAAGGEATVCAARFIEGISDAQIEQLFRAARNQDYQSVAKDARQLTEGAGTHSDRRAQAQLDTARLRRRLDEIAAIDFFPAAEGSVAKRLVAGLEARLRDPLPAPAVAQHRLRPADFRGRTWVTRRSIHVDRIASAWLIRRCIDPEATFRFVAKRHAPAKDELRFDMFAAEFTHEGDRCTFEVLLERFGIEDSALRAIGEIVHDIDLKDGKFGRPETAGIESLIAGLTMLHKTDEVRLERGGETFSDLHAYFQRRAQRDARPARGERA